MNNGQPNKRNAKEQAKFQEEMQRIEGCINLMKSQYLGNLCLIGINDPHGINPTYVQEIAADNIPAVAVRLSATKDGEGMWFDVRQLVFYKVYNTKETEELEEKQKRLNIPAVMPQVV